MQESVKVDREKYIGGSDIPAIMGISPFKSRFDLLLEKAGLKEQDFSGNIYTEYGNVMEPKIREFVSWFEGMEFTEGKHYYYNVKSYTDKGVQIVGNVRIHTDGEAIPEGEDKPVILEIKTTSQIHDRVDDYETYLVQLLFYMWYTEATHGILAIYQRPEDFDEEFSKENLKMYYITTEGHGGEKYRKKQVEILKAVDQFMADLEKVKENPFITEAELMPQDITAAAGRVLELEKALDAMTQVKKRLDEEKENLRKAMESAGVKKWETPNGYKITLVADTPEKTVEETYFDTDSLREEKPDIYAEFEKVRTVTKKGRKGYVKITAPKKEK